MGLYDRDYMYEKRTPPNKKGASNRTSPKHGFDSNTRASQTPRPTTSSPTPDTPDWKTVILWVSITTNIILLLALFILHTG